jgi:release factor glutamine methyltransferase
VTLKEALIATRKTLTSYLIEDPDIDAEILLRHATNLSKDKLYVQYNRELADDESRILNDSIQRRVQGEPIAYILGYKEFFGFEFQVDHSVLIPRPETELLAEKSIKIARQQNMSLIADIGTGSGAIAIVLAKHLPNCTIYAGDISKAALETAKLNCKKHGVDDRVDLVCGNLLEPLPEPVDLIVANLPYVNDEDWTKLPSEIKANEPKAALAGGADGLDAIKELLITASDKLRPNGTMLLEIGYDQGQAVSKLAQRYFSDAKIDITVDLAGLDRVVSIAT